MKTITIRDDTYHQLSQRKGKGDSFSDVIDRIISNRMPDIEQYFGALQKSSVIDQIAEHISETRLLAVERQ